MAQQLGVHELLHVFSFLEARDLLCAAQVSKVWNEVSETTELWRQLSLRRWSSHMVLGTQTWKQYYLCRSELEFRVETGRPEKDYICKAIAGHTGEIDKVAYVSTSEYRFDKKEKSVVCTVSSDCTVRAWDLHEGTEIWSSPLQPAPLVNLVTYPQLQLVATVDKQGLIKVWKAETGWEWASFCLPTSCSAMENFDHPEGSFLLVACAEGTLYTLTVPELQVVSKVTMFPNTSVSLICSPDRQWLFASSPGSDLGPKVFYTQSLLHPSEDEPTVSTTLTVQLSAKACWVPDEAARLIVIHRNDSGRQLVVTTFELKATKSRDRVNILVQQMASFLLPDIMMPPHLMQGHGSQVILLASGSELVLFTIHGLQLVAFRDHQRPITSMWVDPERVITSSFDLSLRVYVWNKENKFPVLKSCYHLLGGSHRWARYAAYTLSLVRYKTTTCSLRHPRAKQRLSDVDDLFRAPQKRMGKPSGFSHVESDGMSIVGVEARSSGTSILRSYCFRVQRGQNDCTG